MAKAFEAPVALEAMLSGLAEPGQREQGSKEQAQKLLEGMPRFKFYRRRKTNKRPRKRTFIMHMTKTPDLLMETLGEQTAAGGSGGKKRKRAALIGGGSSANAGGGGFTLGAAEASISSSVSFQYSSAADAAKDTDTVPYQTQSENTSVPLAASAATFSSPFANTFVNFTGASAASAPAPNALLRSSPFASAFAQTMPDIMSDLPQVPFLDPLADDFVVPSKYTTASNVASSGDSNSNASGNLSLFSDDEDASELVLPKRMRLADAMSGALSFDQFSQPLGTGAYGQVFRGLLNDQPVAVKVPLTATPGSVRSGGMARTGSTASLSQLAAATATTTTAVAPVSYFPVVVPSSSGNASNSSSPRSSLNGSVALSTILGHDDAVYGSLECMEGGDVAEAHTSFNNELRALASAGPHPHVVRALAAQVGDAPCLVLELAPWGSLSDYLLRRGGKDWAALEEIVLARAAQQLGLTDAATLLARAESSGVYSADVTPAMPLRAYLTALVLLAEAAEGAAHLHAAGVVHRDLKPGNILIDAAGSARVADLGSAHFVGEERDVTLAATPQYASPEDLRSETVSDRSDVYSLSYCLWQLLAGQTPWEEVLPAAIVYRVTRAGATPKVSEAWPQQLRGLMAAAWAAAPEQRPAAGEFAAALMGEVRRIVAVVA